VATPESKRNFISEAEYTKPSQLKPATLKSLFQLFWFTLTRLIPFLSFWDTTDAQVSTLAPLLRYWTTFSNRAICSSEFTDWVGAVDRAGVLRAVENRSGLASYPLDFMPFPFATEENRTLSDFRSSI
jgi:hypothetical protein